MQAIAARPRFVAESELAMLGGEVGTILATESGRLGISPTKRTSPRRPLWAIATEIVFLCVSIAT
jgi:hypothetical protein